MENALFIIWKSIGKVTMVYKFLFCYDVIHHLGLHHGFPFPALCTFKSELVLVQMLVHSNQSLDV